ncbi:hypothetical protein GCM10027162_50190 [Streptomyces incanus]
MAFAALVFAALCLWIRPPIEYSFPFVAPALYAVHAARAVLTGVSMAVT